MSLHAMLRIMLTRAGLRYVRTKRSACMVAPGIFGDILAAGWGADGLQTLVIDVVVAMPTGTVPGEAAAIAEGRKFSTYGHSVGNTAEGHRSRGNQSFFLAPFAVGSASALTMRAGRHPPAAQFHRAIPALGLSVPKKDIDALFNEWDKDGGGAIAYKELSKILKATRAKPKAAMQAASAAVALAGGAGKGKD